MARIGRPDILWLVNKLARSITEWTKACDERLPRLISYIHYTSDYKQYCRVGHVNSSLQEALLYVFEDKEAVIRINIKERSPTMRHVSSTHRVALDWLFDRIYLDPKIQIKYIYTKNPTRRHTDKENFTRDEWNHLLCLFLTLAISVLPIVRT